MKKIFYNLVAFLVLACSFVACSPDKYELGAIDLTTDDLVEGIAFQIVHDATNPNIVYLESKLGSQYTVLWDHPQGRSQESRVTLRIPFEGAYSVKFGVQTRGGVVYGVPTTFTVADFCAEFVNDELWTLLTGGVGHSKKWLMDVDEEGTCRYFSGPLHFYGTDDSWETVTNGATPPEGSDSWSWAADWAGNGSWLFGSTGAMDYGSMTFDLINGANITVVDNYNNQTTVGTFLLDTDNHTMRMTDAGLLHDPGRDAIVTQWGNIKVLSLTANAMQLGVIRDNDPSEGPCLLVYNFISEEYKNNWTPTIEDPKPSLPDGWQDDISQVVTSKIVWKLSATNPFDWATLYGERMNNFQSLSDYPDWCTPNSLASDVTLTLDSKNFVYTVALPDGTEIEGSYTLDSEGIYTFDGGLGIYTIGSNWVEFTASPDNQLRVLSYEKNTSGVISDLWLGLPELDGSGKVYQYMAYHFEAQMEAAPQAPTYESRASFFDQGWNFTESNYVGITKEGSYTYTISGGSDSPQGIFFDLFAIRKDYPNASLELISVVIDGTSLSFDPELVSYCDGDDPMDLRIYVYNPWAGDGQAFTMEQFIYTSTIELNVAVSFNE